MNAQKIAKKIAFLRSRSLILRSPIVPRSFDQMAIADPDPIVKKTIDRQSLMLWLSRHHTFNLIPETCTCLFQQDFSSKKNTFFCFIEINLNIYLNFEKVYHVNLQQRRYIVNLSKVFSILHKKVSNKSWIFLQGPTYILAVFSKCTDSF